RLINAFKIAIAFENHPLSGKTEFREKKRFKLLFFMKDFQELQEN
ncbi:19570_t:CDS:1, partial [Funneliformis geosporum]